MMADLSRLVVIGAEQIPPDHIMARLVLPIGILAFFGSTYLLLRSNLGTRRAYYVLATSTFGFLFLMSLFWGFGAPGTPQTTGPQNLPGQPSDALLPKWIPFAQDSLLADRDEFTLVRNYPEGFELADLEDVEAEEPAGPWPQDLHGEIGAGVEDVREFFASESVGQQVGAAWAPIEVGYAPSAEGRPVIGVAYQETDEAGDLVADGATYLAFGFFDEGNPLLPSLLFAAGWLVLFLLHAWLLDRDERRERRRREQLEVETVEEPVAAGV